jgi:hypothetical protein
MNVDESGKRDRVACTGQVTSKGDSPGTCFEIALSAALLIASLMTWASSSPSSKRSVGQLPPSIVVVDDLTDGCGSSLSLYSLRSLSAKLVLVALVALELVKLVLLTAKSRSSCTDSSIPLRPRATAVMASTGTSRAALSASLSTTARIMRNNCARKEQST